MGSIGPQDLLNGDHDKSNEKTVTFESASSHLLLYAPPSTFSPMIITRTSGTKVYTSDGHEILDWTSGQMSCLIGHGHPEIVETLTHHAKHLDHLFSGFTSPPVVALADKLATVLPDGLDRSMFLSTGGESNDAAIRLAKVVTGKWEIVGLSCSWHGMTGAANAAQYWFGRSGHGPTMPGNLALPAPNTYRSVFRHADGSHDWQTELDYGWSMIDRSSAGSLAAVIMEPILSSGGMLTLPPGYMKAMKKHCEARGMLLIVDEAQTALGRCGDMFGFEEQGVVPDILTLSKTLGNGMPLSAVVTSNEIAEKAKENNFLFYTTHVNDPLPAAVGLKVIEIVLRDGLVEKARRSGEMLKKGLETLMKKYACIGEVRGRGLMIGVEIVEDRRREGWAGKQPNAGLGTKLSQRMMQLGLSANLLGNDQFGGIFRIAPPIVVEENEIRKGLAIFERALHETEGTKYIE